MLGSDDFDRIYGDAYAIDGTRTKELTVVFPARHCSWAKITTYSFVCVGRKNELDGDSDVSNSSQGSFAEEPIKPLRKGLTMLRSNQWS